ncbi:transport and Golgi organization 2 homolog isoform X2 [Diaphorina citri]|uniref:Transport and Golgi organization 2 homolog isoform X2 n=1 Tax=Diaphorina citri TaxID=121845 RepID=A0A3Q0J7L2_DIACI|nr:transport and Golgi organization 2 homolog isoform X2 [Diaphorina citri]
MCITFMYCNHNSPLDSYKLVLASNRDEDFRRETKPLHQWPNRDVIGGQDAVKGGTWLATSTNGKLGILLNVLGENSRPNGRDRGPLVVKYVEGQKSAEEYLTDLKKETEENVFNGFHIVLLELTLQSTNIYHFSNIAPLDSPSTKVTNVTNKQENKDHVYGFGNSQCTSQPFQKVIFGKEKFAEIVNKFNRKSESQNLIQNILDLMKNKQSNYPDPEIDRKAEADMDEDYKMRYSRVCVDISSIFYGTRTHSIILVDHNNVMDFHEWTLDYETKKWIHTHIRKTLNMA